MTATISSLSGDLLEEIISRIPMKSMRAVRLTCKKWETLSKSRIFTKIHIGKLGEAREGESRMVVMMDDSLHLMSVVVDDDDDDPPSTECKGKLIACLNDSGQVIRFTQIHYCEGLFLCILKDDNTRVVVWNPYWEQTRWIETRFCYRPPGRTWAASRIQACSGGQNKFSYAFGYENKKSCRSLKFLRFIDVSRPGISVYEIYNFDSDLWTTLAFDQHWRIASRSLGLSLKGNTYWVASKRRSPMVYRVPDHIICFDFTRERFGPLLPLPCRPKDDRLRGHVTLACVKEEKLAAFFYHGQPLGQPMEIEIWITTKIEAQKEISWSKLVTVEAGPNANIPIEPIYGSFFIDEVKKVALLFENMYGRHTLTIIGFSGSVPCLVQVKQPPRRRSQRKRQCSLESRQYQLKKMLRLPIWEQFPTICTRTHL